MSDTATAAAAPEAGPLRRWLRRYSIAFYALTLALLLGTLALAPRIFIQIPAGHVGVLWLRFFGGTVTDHVYREGLRVIFPWDRMTLYDARLANDTRTYQALSSNGLTMQAEISLRYRINPPAAGYLHKLAGPHYPDTLVAPEIASVAMEIFARYLPEQVYSDLRQSIQQDMRARVLARFAVPPVAQDMGSPGNPPPLIQVENVLIRSVILPAMVREAIEHKIQQQQVMLEYDYRIEREKKERDRKRIEAEGIRDFQDVVARTITPEYLRLRGIDATNALATSNNSKMVIIGGKDGLPIILNTGDDAPRPVLPRSTTGEVPAQPPVPTTTSPPAQP